MARSSASTTLKQSHRPKPLRAVAPRPERMPSLSYVPPDLGVVEEEAGKFQPRETSPLMTARGRRVSDAALAGARNRMQPPAAITAEDLQAVARDVDFTAAFEAEHPLPTFTPKPHDTQNPNITNAPREGTAAVPAFSLRALVVADGDLLWDWMRASGDHGRILFGRPVTTTIELHTLLQTLVQAERVSHALIRTLDAQGSPIGVVLLNPILLAEQTALVTVYLRPELRAQYEHILPIAVNLASQLVPYHLALPAFDAHGLNLYRAVLAPLGFREHTLFVK